uniref:hypothetical protein n=1 Tax=Flavobacterium sp. TaxID=239 RepID=UPI00404B9FFA
MNIESLISKIELFEDLIIKSGFKRDANDYLQSIQQGQNQNLVFMKDLSQKVKNKLLECENYGLESELEKVLRDNKPFTELGTLAKLEELDNNTEIDGNSYFSKFSQILSLLIQKLDSNKTELNNVLKIFQKYVSLEKEYEFENEQAIVSLIFKDLKSTGSLKEFAKILNRWNRMLLVYHTLLTSESPDEISLVEIQNGSIDVIFNIDFDIAIDLTELIRTGLKVYGAYLLYKSKTAKEIILSYMGNVKLIKQEKEREKLMLENIKESIYNKALEQHKERIKTDKNIEKASINVKLEEVSSVITEHIVKGNELKLLTAPEINEEDEENLGNQLREETAIVRERFKKLEPAEKQFLLEKFTIKDESENK